MCEIAGVYFCTYQAVLCREETTDFAPEVVKTFFSEKE